jgi:hypothetical protein
MTMFETISLDDLAIAIGGSGSKQAQPQQRDYFPKEPIEKLFSGSDAPRPSNLNLEPAPPPQKVAQVQMHPSGN